MLDRFRELVASDPSAPAIFDGARGVVITRQSLQTRARELARRLSGAGLSAGDILAVQLPNSADFVATLLAVLELRLVIALIDRDAAESEVVNVLSHFGVRGFVYLPDSSSETVISTRLVHERSSFPAAAQLIKLTSGSTGLPKAIVCSEANLAADCRNICTTMHIAPDDVNLGAIPFSHSYGFSNLVTPLIWQGTPIVVSNDYLPLSILELCNRYGCTVAPLIPIVYEHLSALPKEDGAFRSVRTFVSAGAPLLAGTSRRFRDRFGSSIQTFYGCSEVGGITYDRVGGAVERGSAGSALDGVRLDLDPSTQRLTVRSDSVALGYLLDTGLFSSFDGAFTTEDLVEVAGESQGEVTITGRVGDLINTAGKKVNPREVEQIILQMEGVREAKVYGEPAGARGEVVAAAVVANPDVTREQIREFCRTRLALYKVPRIVKLIEQLPIDERGKVKRAALAAL